MIYGLYPIGRLTKIRLDSKFLLLLALGAIAH